MTIKFTHLPHHQTLLLQVGNSGGSGDKVSYLVIAGGGGGGEGVGGALEDIEKVKLLQKTATQPHH